MALTLIANHIKGLWALTLTLYHRASPRVLTIRVEIACRKIVAYNQYLRHPPMHFCG
jgi:hypothetical protein